MLEKYASVLLSILVLFWIIFTTKEFGKIGADKYVIVGLVIICSLIIIEMLYLVFLK